MKLICVVCLLCCSSRSLIALTIDDLIEDSSWNTYRRADVPNEDVIRLQEALNEATRKANTGEIEAFGPVDCFGLNPVLQFAVRWMFKPFSFEKIDTHFYLVNRENSTPKDIKPGKNCRFGSFRKRRTAVIVHGFMSNGKVSWVNDMAKALVEKQDYNVIIVDWAGGSESWRYWRAVANTHVVGKSLDILLKNLVNCGLLELKDIHCIGHSLGAHICSFAARTSGPFGRITGLDPAEPCFSGHGLNRTDASYVDVIHTNTAVFGQAEHIGVKDFYPNGGQLMPGCVIRGNVFFDKLNIVKQLESAVCSHGRSYEYFIDSLRYYCKLWGHTWDLDPKNAWQGVGTECLPETCAPLGLDSVYYPSRGKYYVPTRNTKPFCIPVIKINWVMHLWSKIINKLYGKH